MTNKLTGKQTAGCIMGILGMCITPPIWYWLIYQILVRVDATPTMWVFYWIYMPVGLVLAVAKTATENLFDGKE